MTDPCTHSHTHTHKSQLICALQTCFQSIHHILPSLTTRKWCLQNSHTMQSSLLAQAVSTSSQTCHRTKSYWSKLIKFEQKKPSSPKQKKKKKLTNWRKGREIMLWQRNFDKTIFVAFCNAFLYRYCHSIIIEF